MSIPWLRTLFGWLLIAGIGAFAAEAAAPAWPGEAPQFVVTTWQIPQGLPSDRVRAVWQTREGYLWVATYNGAAQFDGVRFRVFNDANTPALRNGLINSLFEDDQGRLWLGSDTGEITWRDEGGFHALSLTNGGEGSAIIGFAQSPEGTLWALNRGGFILRLREGKIAGTLGRPTGPLYSDIVRDTEGQVWAIRYGGTVVRLQPNGQAVEGEAPAPPAGFRTIAPARQGGLWLRDEERLRRWQHGRWVEDRGAHPWGTRQAIVLYEAANGEVWAGTRDNGLFVVAPDGSEQHLNRANGLTDDVVSSIAQDREGNVWVGSDGGGLERLRRRALFMITPPERFPVVSVAPARGGGLWVGTDGAGIYRFQAGQFTHLESSNVPTSKNVRTVLEDRAGRLWVGTEVRERLMNGLLVQDRSGRLSVGAQGGGLLLGRPAAGGEMTLERCTNASLVLPSLFFAAYEDRQGTVWMGSPEGLLRLEQDHWSKLGTELFRPEVRCLTETPDRALWLGMRGGGVARYRDGKFTQLLRAQGLPYEYAWAILGDADGVVWIGTPGAGLIRWRAGRFDSFTTRQGLPSDFICSLLDDGQGHLWVGSHGGIFKVAKAELDRCATGSLTGVNCFVLNASDGLSSLELAGGTQPSACRTADGRLWFATSGGLAMVEPARISTNALAPPVRLEEVVVDGKTLALGAAATSAWEVGPGQNQVELRYTALSFCDPQRVRFRYRLHGVDSAWVEAGSRRSAYYAHLSPGQYRFEVTACNNDGVWNAAGARMSLSVRPFFWQTWWFAPLCWVGGLSSVGAGIITGLRRRHQARIQVLEQARLLERERGRIARDLHDELGSGLTDIGMTSAMGEDPEVPAEEARESLREINQRSHEMVVALDEIVWAVNPKNDDLGSLTTYFCQFAEQFVRRTTLSCRFEIPEGLPPLPLKAEQRHSLFLAFKEALQNAVKHAEASSLRVSVGLSGGRLEITVEDNGRGFESEKLKAGADGLRNMRERLEQLGGKCEIETAPGKGTRVRFWVPVGGRLGGEG